MESEVHVHPSSIKAVAFDFWGVFAPMQPPMDSFLRHHRIDPAPHQKDVHDLIIEHDLARLTEEQFLAACSKLLGITIPYPECKYTFRPGALNHNLIALVEKLRSNVRTALCSNTNMEYSREYIFKPGLDTLFDVVVLSYQVGYRKPAPEMYRILIQRLALPPEQVLFLDDDPTKFPAAKAQGLQTLIYTGRDTDRVLTRLLLTSVQ